LTQCSKPEKLRPVSDDDVSRVPVEVRLLRVQRVTGRGTLKWLFDVQIRSPPVRHNSVVAMGDGCRRW
jgi:hypothetical protein